jgi:hypothetical protein
MATPLYVHCAPAASPPSPLGGFLCVLNIGNPRIRRIVMNVSALFAVVGRGYQQRCIELARSR